MTSYVRDCEFVVSVGNIKETVKPLVSKQNRILRQNKRFYVPLPRRKLCVKWKGKFVVGPNSKTVWGITNQIQHRLKTLSFDKNEHNEFLMKSLGNSVDREIKRFAKDLIGFEYLKNPESKRIIAHLGKKHITLVTSSVLVSNFKLNYVCSEKYSGTEIDVIGYDHNNRKYVIIEIKITSFHIRPLIEDNMRAKTDELSQFKKSFIGMCTAQLACTTLMFKNTYINDCYPLLVICENDGICESFVLEDDCLEPTQFSGFINGY